MKRIFLSILNQPIRKNLNCFLIIEVTAGIPTVIFAIRTWKENGKPNVCFHSWSCFHGDKTAFFAVMGNLYQHTHTYDNIQGQKYFCINFLPISCYDKLVNTIHQNEMNDDEFVVDGLTASDAQTIHLPAINEAVFAMECTMKEIQGLSGAIVVINEKHPMPDDFIGDRSERFFRFEKYYDSDKHCQK